MSIRVMSELFGLQLGSAHRKMVALRLADFADDQGRGIWPTVARVAAECEISERTVQRILADFVAEGVLVVVAAGGGAPGSSTRYDFDLGVVHRLAKIGEAPAGATGATGAAGSARDTGDTVSPVAGGERGDSGAQRGDSGDAEGCHGDTRTVIEPPIEPSVERERGGEGGQGREAGEAAPGPQAAPDTQSTLDPGSASDPRAVMRAFERAFRDWPTSLTDSRPEALKAWGELSPAEREAAAREAGRYVEAARSIGRRHICSHGVYLREKRWEGLPPAPAERPKHVDAPPWGPVWGFVRMRALLTETPEAGPPLPPRSEYMRTLLAQDDAAGRRARMERQAKFGWPGVNRLHEGADNRRGILVAPHLEAGKALMAQVRVGSDLWAAWKAEHARRGWPWLPDPGRVEWVYFPAGGPEGLGAFEAAAKQVGEGRRDDGGGREAA